MGRAELPEGRDIHSPALGLREPRHAERGRVGIFLVRVSASGEWKPSGADARSLGQALQQHLLGQRHVRFGNNVKLENIMGPAPRDRRIFETSKLDDAMLRVTASWRK